MAVKLKEIVSRIADGLIWWSTVESIRGELKER